MAEERFEFSVTDDLTILREIIAKNPYEDSQLWKEIHQKIIATSGKNFSLRMVKKHADYLLNLWQRENRINVKKSETKEQYMEKKQLLQEISDMAREAKRHVSDSNAKKWELEAKKKAFCNSCISEVEALWSHTHLISNDMANNLCKECFSSTPSTRTFHILEAISQRKKKCRERAILRFCQENHKSNQAIKTNLFDLLEFQLNEIRASLLELEKEKLEMEMKERRQRICKLRRSGI